MKGIIPISVTFAAVLLFPRVLVGEQSLTRLVAHPVTHENVGTSPWIGAGIGIRIGVAIAAGIGRPLATKPTAITTPIPKATPDPSRVSALFSDQATQEVTREKILASPQWQQKYDGYEPVAEMIEALKGKVGSNIKIDVYLGLWCPDSRNNVPPFLKILDRIGTDVAVRYFDSPRKASRDVKYYVEEMKVEKVPTFIVYRDGQEIGRIIENPKTGMLEDLMDILFKQQVAEYR